MSDNDLSIEQYKTAYFIGKYYGQEWTRKAPNPQELMEQGKKTVLMSELPYMNDGLDFMNEKIYIPEGDICLEYESKIFEYRVNWDGSFQFVIPNGERGHIRGGVSHKNGGYNLFYLVAQGDYYVRHVELFLEKVMWPFDLSDDKRTKEVCERCYEDPTAYCLYSDGSILWEREEKRDAKCIYKLTHVYWASREGALKTTPETRCITIKGTEND